MSGFPRFVPEGGTALLIDGENVSHKHAPAVMEWAAQGHTPRVARVYGAPERIPDWARVAGLMPVWTDGSPQSADMRLAIDAMALLWRDGIRSFVIASADGGFATLVLHLREAGSVVRVISDKRASERLVAACDIAPRIVAPVAATPVAAAPHPELEKAVKGYLTTDPKISVSALGIKLIADNIRVTQLQQKLRELPHVCRIVQEGKSAYAVAP